MITSKGRNEGITLLEVLLVLAVGASILYMSIQQYLSYRHDADVIQVQANVNAIFQAMSGYYKQNCYGPSPNGTLTAGSLNPLNATPPNVNTHIDITNDLSNAGFLTVSLPLNPIVNSAGAGTKGYIAQFNMNTAAQNRQICITGTNAAMGPTDPACSAQRNVGSITMWSAQVAVQLKDTAQAKQYLNLLGGDCLSSASGNIVTPCTTGSTGTYVVWTRLPSNSNTKALSDYWQTMPSVSRFTQMYTTYPILDLTNGARTSDQYYLCGN